MPQDFVMRMIQQVAQMLASILAYRKAGRNEEAQKSIEQQCFRTTGLPLLLVKMSTPEDLLTMLDSGPAGLRCTRKIMLAELLIQDAEIDEAAGRFDEGRRTEVLAVALIAAAVEALPADEARMYRGKWAALREKGGVVREPEA